MQENDSLILDNAIHRKVLISYDTMNHLNDMQFQNLTSLRVNFYSSIYIFCFSHIFTYLLKYAGKYRVSWKNALHSNFLIWSNRAWLLSIVNSTLEFEAFLLFHAKDVTKVECWKLWVSKLKMMMKRHIISLVVFTSTKHVYRRLKCLDLILML